MATNILFHDARAEQVQEPPGDEALDEQSLLWVDVKSGEDGDIQQIAERFALDKDTVAQLVQPSRDVTFMDAGPYIHLSFATPVGTGCDDDLEMAQIQCLLGERWVVTAHDRDLPVLGEFAKRTEGSGETGSLDGPGFVAVLVEWVLGEYERAFEAVEEALEEFDVNAMQGDVDLPGERVATLVTLRRRIGVLRRSLVEHRGVLVALSHPELGGVTSEDAARRFQELLGRFELTLASARDAREAIVGSFDVLIASSGHRTNEIMKILTLTTVILLPGSLVAGLMGMNFKVGIFDHAGGFWIVIASIIAFAAGVAFFARRHNWVTGRRGSGGSAGIRTGTSDPNASSVQRDCKGFTTPPLG